MFWVRIEFPKYVGWIPTWTEHAVIVFEFQGSKVYLDKRLQGGSDHIAFERHPDLIYPDDARYAEELRRQEEAREREFRRQQERGLKTEEILFPPRSAGFPYEGPC